MKTRFLTKLALLCCGWGVFSDAVVVPLVTSISSEFSDASPFMINFILSGPALVGLFSGLLAGIAARRFNHKRLLVGSTLLFSIAGAVAAASPNIEFLALTRAIDGATDGFEVVLVATLICELFPDEHERSQLLGWHWSVAAFFGIIMAFLSGLIGVQSWRLAFLVNLISFAAPIMVLLFVPSVPAAESRVPAGQAVEAARPSVDHRAFPYAWVTTAVGAFFLINVLFNVVYFLIDPYVAERALGNSAVSGALTSIGTIGCLIAGLVFGNIYKRTKRVFPILFFLGCGAAVLLLYLPLGVLLVGFAAFAANAFFTVSQPYYQTVAADKVPANKLPLVMSALNVAQCLGLTFAPFVPGFLESAFGTRNLAEAFGAIGTALSAIALTYFIGYFAARRRQGKKYALSNV